jgi:hypothetical protein
MYACACLWNEMQEHITLHVTFPPNFPFSPPFIRVVRPRFAFRTGHVTVGGSICTLMLTNDGWIASTLSPPPTQPASAHRSARSPSSPLAPVSHTQPTAWIK